jgi:integrase
MLSVGQR